MTITLHPELEQFIDRLVRTGRFQSPNAAIADAILRMKERDEKVTWLRHELQRGIDQLDRGEGEPWHVEEMKARLKNKYAGLQS